MPSFACAWIFDFSSIDRCVDNAKCEMPKGKNVRKKRHRTKWKAIIHANDIKMSVVYSISFHCRHLAWDMRIIKQLEIIPKSKPHTHEHLSHNNGMRNRNRSLVFIRHHYALARGQKQWNWFAGCAEKFNASHKLKWRTTEKQWKGKENSAMAERMTAEAGQICMFAWIRGMGGQIVEYVHLLPFALARI